MGNDVTVDCFRMAMLQVLHRLTINNRELRLCTIAGCKTLVLMASWEPMPARTRRLIADFHKQLKVTKEMNRSILTNGMVVKNLADAFSDYLTPKVKLI